MLNKIISRLRDSRGETLVESMAAILVFTLASIAFLTMVSTSSNINQTVRDSDLQIQSQQQIAEAGDVSEAEEYDLSIKLNLTDEAGSPVSGDELYGDTVFVVSDPADPESLYAYYAAGGE